MRMLKYVLVFILVIVLGCCAIIPWMDGYRFRKDYLAAIAKFNQSSPNNHFQVESYHLGWLSSHAVIRYIRTQNPNQPKDKGYLIDQHISHGPYIHFSSEGWVSMAAFIKSHAVMDSEIATLINLSTSPVIDMETRVDFDHAADSHFTFTSFVYDSGRIKVNVQDGDGNIKYEEGQPLTYGIHFNNVDVNFVLQAIHLKINEIQSAHEESCQQSLCHSAHHYVLPNIVFGKGSENFTITNTDVNYSSSMSSDNQISNAITFQVNKIANSIGEYGPLTFSVNMQNLDLGAFNQAYAQLAAQNSPMAEVFKKVNLLVAKDSLITNQIQLTTPYGIVAAKGKMHWPENVALPQSIDDIKSHMDINLDINVATGVIDQMIQWMTAKIETQQAALKSKFQMSGANSLDKDSSDLLAMAKNFIAQKKMDPSAIEFVNSVLKANAPMPVFIVLVEKASRLGLVMPDAAQAMKMQYAKIVADRLQAFKSVLGDGKLADTNALNAKVMELADKGLLTSSFAKQLVLMQSQDLDTSIYKTMLDSYSSKGELDYNQAAVLVQAYAQIHGDEVPGGANNTPKDAKSQLQSQVNDLVKDGYFSQDDNGYSVSLVYANGALTFNGKSYESLMAIIKPKPPVPVTNKPAVVTPPSSMPAVPAAPVLPSTNKPATATAPMPPVETVLPAPTPAVPAPSPAAPAVPSSHAPSSVMTPPPVSTPSTGGIKPTAMPPATTPSP